MKNHSSPFFCRFILSILSICIGLFLKAEASEDADGLLHFRESVHPILQENCFKCHGGGEKLRGGLRLTSRKGIISGGDSGPAVNLQDPASSLLLDMISYRDDDHEMPPDGKLSERDLDVLRQWVSKGIPYDSELEIEKKEVHSPSEFLTEINDQTRNYWAFKPIVKPMIKPIISDSNEIETNPIDVLVSEKLLSANIQPNPPASKQQLIRRAFYGLIGLPPTIEEVDEFEKDPSPDAFEKVIDRLLSMPQYGEKWGRHWLDLVRYAETNGYERDGPKPESWRYRDYVIDAFNKDKPYDRFIREQLAGDEMPFSKADASSKTDALIATGFQRLGIWDDEPADPDQAYYEGLDDVLSTTSSVFLGLTIGCARCHDHKIDPLPQRDYYRMLAFFHNTFSNIRQGKFKKSPYTLNTLRVIATEAEKVKHQKMTDDHHAEMETLEERIEHFENIVMSTFSNPEKEDAKDNRTREIMIRQKREGALDEDQLDRYLRAKTRYERIKKRRFPKLASALSIRENGRQAPETFVLVRGNAHVRGERVEPGYPDVLGFADPIIPPAPEGVKSSGRRTVLANWIASSKNPLTARVIANRVWHFHFGKGIVASPSNFGQNGERPTHPELLDYLAAKMIEVGWSLKQFHKQIMLSETYQRSSFGNEVSLAKDPRNDLLWRFDMRRLTAEEVRDSLLNVSGMLNLKMGGPSIFTDIPEEVRATASRPNNAWGRSETSEQFRRSVYVYVKRSLHEPMLKAFDSADTDSSCAVRFSTTVPTQSLTMLNSQFVNSQASAFADRLEIEAGASLKRQVELGLSLVMNRRPMPHEIEDGMKMIKDLRQKTGLNERLALERFCLMALNLNEFIYLD